MLSLPTFIGILWAIWKLRNAQIFRHQRPTPALIALEIQVSTRQHGIFTNDSFDPTRNPLDPSIPPGFNVAHIGQQHYGSPSITIQIAGKRRKSKCLGSTAWIGMMATPCPTLRHASICFTSSNISVIALACLQALTWVQGHHHTQLHILTTSSELIHLLRSTKVVDIRIRWTIDAIK